MDDDKLLGYQRLLSIIYNKFGKDKFLEVIDELEKCDEKSYQVFLDIQKEVSDKLIYEMRMRNTTCYLNFLQNQIKAKKITQEYFIHIPYWEVYRKSNGEYSGLRKNGSLLDVE